MRHHVHHHVDRDGVAFGRETIEVLHVFAFALPGIRDVGVVRHQHHQPAFFVEDPRVLTTALSEPRSDVSPPFRRHWLIAGTCRMRFTLIDRLEHRVRHGDVDDGVIVARQHASDFALPYVPGARAPEVVAPHEAALPEVQAQAAGRRRR